MFGWDRLTYIGAALPTAPIDLAAAKAHCHVDFADDDALLSGLIDAARSFIDGPRGIGICMVDQQWRLSLDGFETTTDNVFGPIIEIPMGPLKQVDAIKYVDSAGAQQTVASGDYLVDKSREIARIMPAYGKSWPPYRLQSGAVQIDFTAGFGADGTKVPGALKTAMLHLIAFWYENRGATEDGSGSTQIPITVKALLQNYRVGHVR